MFLAASRHSDCSKCDQSDANDHRERNSTEINRPSWNWNRQHRHGISDRTRRLSDEVRLYFVFFEFNDEFDSIWKKSTPGGNTTSAAEHTCALICALARFVRQ